MSQYSIQTQWDLAKFYSGLNDPKLAQDIASLTPKVHKFIESYKGKIAQLSPQEFIEFFKTDEEIDHLINKIAIYYHSLETLQGDNQEVIKANGEFTNLLVELSNQTLFISQEFKDIGSEKLLSMSQDPLFSDYKNFFVRKAQSIQYILDVNTEKALNLKDNAGSSAFNQLYQEYTTSFVFKMNLDGEEKEMTEDEVRSLRASSDENIRKEAYRSLRQVYNQKSVQIVLGNTYSALVKDWTSDVKIRGYKEVASPRNRSEQIPDEAINMLIQEVINAYPTYHKYLAIKTKLMGKEKMDNWNILAPLNEVEKNYTLDEALDVYFEVIKGFDDEFYKYSLEMFEQGRVDVYPKAGKRGGAFCMSEKGFESMVMLNFTNKVRDISTIAHELGHAIHGHLSQTQKYQVYNCGLCLAETASVFNETLLNSAISHKLEGEERLNFLDNQISDIAATVFRQIQYIAFEKTVHESILSGKELTYGDFNILWRQEQEKLFGDAVEYDVPASEETGWAGIPHIFRSPFYCYSYSFGNLLSLSLYEMYREKGSEFVETYKNILRSGDSMAPYDLLIQNGIDISKPQFYQKGLQVIAELVQEFEGLAKSLGKI